MCKCVNCAYNYILLPISYTTADISKPADPDSFKNPVAGELMHHQPRVHHTSSLVGVRHYTPSNHHQALPSSTFSPNEVRFCGVEGGHQREELLLVEGRHLCHSLYCHTDGKSA